MRFLPLLLVGIFLSPAVLHADVPSSKSSSEAAKNLTIAVKLDEILSNQKEILKQLAELKQEVLIVKARATR